MEETKTESTSAVEELIKQLQSRLDAAEKTVNSVAAKQKDAEDKIKEEEKESELRKKFEEEFKQKYGIKDNDDKGKEQTTKTEEKKEDTDTTQTTAAAAGKAEDTNSSSANVGVSQGQQNLGSTEKKYKTVADIISAARRH